MTALRNGLRVPLLLCLVSCPVVAGSLKPHRSARDRQTANSGKTNRPYRGGDEDYAASEAPAEKLLIFWATGSSQDTVDLIKKNVKHARQELSDVTVFLAHYDHERAAWKGRAGKEWYEKNVKGSVEQEGYKFQLLKSLVNSREINPLDYDWVWVLDEDADFKSTPLRRMLQLATESGALISTPAFTSTRGRDAMSYPFQQPRSDCRYRYASIIEVTFPLFRAKALQSLMTSCSHCMGKSTVWGLDRVWCSWSARQLGRKKAKACAILDGARMVHRDFRTLNGKYATAVPYALQGALNAFKRGFLEVNRTTAAEEAQGEHPGSPGFYAMASREQDDVRKHHPDDYVTTKGSQMRELSCVN